MSIHLAPMPSTTTDLILVGTTIRKSLPVVTAYLQTLAWQELPPRTEVRYCFVLDTTEPEVIHAVESFVSTHTGVVFRGPATTGDYVDNVGPTHQWTPSAMQRVGTLKNQILAHGVAQNAAAVWLVDADVLCDRTTLRTLWAGNTPITCGVYWTHWHQTGLQRGHLHAAPQVWLTHPYGLEGRGYEAATFRQKLLDRQRIQVWGQGACSLIRRVVLDKGVTFSHLPNVSIEGMMAGEDRHFCIAAESAHLAMCADGWPDIFHCYHPSDLQNMDTYLGRLGLEHPTTPAPGDLVNVVLDALEPHELNPGQWHNLPTQYLRGRLGTLSLLPELEEAIATLKRGSSVSLPLNYPTHYPIAPLRGKRKLVRVTLVDCKPMGYPPVIEQELLIGTQSQRYVDRTTLSAAQQA